LSATLVPLAIGAHAAISSARAAALVQYYGAPLQLYWQLSHHLESLSSRSQHVCVGKEWYRAPGSFFLPPSAMPLLFVRAGFNGLLPAPFESPAPLGSRAAPSHFNDANREETSLYVRLDVCDWLVDLNLLNDDGPTGFKATEWQVWQREPFLDASRSRSWSRTLFIPFITEGHNTFADYVVYQRRFSA